MLDIKIDWQHLIDQMADMVICVDREFRYLYVNAAWSRSSGMTIDDCRGKTPWEFGLPDNVSEIFRFASEQVYTSRAPYRFEFPFFVAQQQHQFSTDVIPQCGGDGAVEALLVVTRDITDHHQASARLTESEDRFRAFMDHSPGITWMKDEAGRYVFVSRAFERQYRLQRADWIGKTDAELWPKQIAQQFRENDLAVLADGQMREFLEVSRNPDGSASYWQVCKFLFRDALGRQFVGGTGIDVTARQEAAVQAGLLSAIVEASHDAIISKDLQGRILTWNASAERMFGYTAAEMIGASVLQLIPPELQHEEQEILYRIRRGEQIGHYETIRCRQDGQRIPVSLTVSPVRDAEGNIVAASKIVRQLDVPQRLQLLKSAVPS